jgi:8-oxo-dGTP pyrophosphatase MutT (NUDIX family)
MTPLKQVAALPYVETADGRLVLLITTRGFGRWSIPKGWPKAGIADHETAAREAFEEAGIKGEVGAQPIGSFRYAKRLHLLSWAKCSVDVYPLHAECQHLSWPEQQSRRTLWVHPDKAASMVRASQLAEVLRGIASGQRLTPSSR